MKNFKLSSNDQTNKIVSTKKDNPYVVIGLLIVVAGTFGYMFFGGNSKGSSNTQANTATTSSLVSVGEEGRLNSGVDKTLVATTEASYERMVQLRIAGDTDGLLQLTLSGYAFLADSGTKVRVIGRTTGAREVRILEGQFYGRSGFVQNEFVKN